MMTINSIDKIIEMLLSFEKVTVITHVRPDGDTLGSANALSLALNKIGKHAHVVCESKISPRYLFLTDGKDNIANECMGNIVCVDVAEPSMAGSKYEQFAINADIVIDHHSTNSGFGKLHYIDPDAASCGEIVLKIISKLCDIDVKMAECLYTAVSTDTGCFVYANTTAETHLAAGQMISAGADIKKLNKLLFRTKSHASLEIQRRAFETMEYFHDNSVACMRISLDWIENLSATEDDIEGITSIPTQIEKVKAGVTFRQIGVDTYKLSVRTNGEVDGALICKKFGGGGHKMAAGCTLTGNYNELKVLLADKLFEGLKK